MPGTFRIIISACPKTPGTVIARRFLPQQSPDKTAEIASSQKALLAMTAWWLFRTGIIYILIHLFEPGKVVDIGDRVSGWLEHS